MKRAMVRTERIKYVNNKTSLATVASSDVFAESDCAFVRFCHKEKNLISLPQVLQTRRQWRHFGGILHGCAQPCCFVLAASNSLELSADAVSDRSSLGNVVS